tara:strand:+ start:94 stop:312 length:219 start_codon:yes stop_codon:yes gene_type:complete
MAIHYGRPAIFGYTKVVLPLKGFPEGKKSIHLRSEDFAVVKVETKGLTISFFIEESDGFWVPAVEAGRDYFL